MEATKKEKQTQTSWKSKNKEHVKEYNKSYYENNKEYWKSYNKEYKKKNKKPKWAVTFGNGDIEHFNSMKSVAERLGYPINSCYDFRRKRGSVTLSRFPDIKIEKCKPFCKYYRNRKAKEKESSSSDTTESE